MVIGIYCEATIAYCNYFQKFGTDITKNGDMMKNVLTCLFGLIIMVQANIAQGNENSYFPICAWMGPNHCMEPRDELTYNKILSTIDSAYVCGFNMIFIGCMPGRDGNGLNWNTRPLRRIDSLGMKCLLGAANVAAEPPSTYHNIEWFSTAMYRRYEAECDTFFTSDDSVYVENGCRVINAGRTGFVVKNYQSNIAPDPYYVNNIDCRMPMGGGWYESPTRQYNLTYRLKYVGTNDGSDVCMLRCIKLDNEGGSPVTADSVVLKTTDFQSPDVFFDKTLSFTRGIGVSRRMDYQLYSFGNKKVYLDYITLHDTIYDSLSAGYYNTLIDSIKSEYANTPVYRYFFFDEPIYSQLPAQSTVNAKIGSMGCAVIGPNVINNYASLGLTQLAETTYFDAYAAIVHPQQIVTNMVILSGENGRRMGYPYTGAGDSGYSTPYSGKGLQDQYDILCKLSRNANRVGKAYDIPWWIEINIFGDSLYETNPPSEGIWRLATPWETRCMVNLSLCHGAKGLFYYQFVESVVNYNGYWGEDRIYKQLAVVDSFGKRRDDKLYEAVKETNFRIQKLAPTLLSLDCDYSSRKQNGSLTDSQIIRDVSDTLVQIGIFHNKGSTGWNDKYFMAVNRNCLPGDTIHNLALKVWYPYPFKIKDVLKAKDSLPDSLSQELATRPTDFNYIIALAPGEGRLYQIVCDSLLSSPSISGHSWNSGLFDEWYALGNLYAKNDAINNDSYIRFTAQRPNGTITLDTNFTVDPGSQFEANIVDEPGNYTLPSFSPGIFRYGFNVSTDSAIVNEKATIANLMNIPKVFVLSQNYPNPIGNNTSFKYQLPKSCSVRLSIYNIAGQLVKRFEMGSQQPGYYTIKWDADRVANGVYIYKLNAGDFQSVKKMMVLK